MFCREQAVQVHRERNTIRKRGAELVFIGIGNRHFAEAFRAGAAAAAAGNFFHFTEHSAIVAKRALVAEAAPVRLDTYVTYERLPLGDNGRVARQADDVLDALRFEYIPEEVI